MTHPQLRQKAKQKITTNKGVDVQRHAQNLAQKKRAALSQSVQTREGLKSTPHNAEKLWQQTFAQIKKFAKTIGLSVMFRYSKARGYSLIPGRELMVKANGHIYPIDSFQLDTMHIRTLRTPKNLLTDVIRKLLMNTAIYGLYRTRTAAAEDLLKSLLKENGNITLNKQTWRLLRSKTMPTMKRPKLKPSDYIPPKTVKPASSLAQKISKKDKEKLKKQNLLDLPAALPEALKKAFVQEADFFGSVIEEMTPNNPDLKAMIGNIKFYSSIQVKKDNFQISKEKSGEWALKVNSLYLNHEKTAIPPLRIALSDGKNLFKLREHLVKYIIRLVRRVTLTRLSEEIRDKITREPKNDSELKRISVGPGGTMLWDKKPVHDFDYRGSESNMISFHSASSIKINRSGSQIFVTGEFGSGPNKSTLTAELIRENGKAYLKQTSKGQRKLIDGKKLLAGAYDKELFGTLSSDLPPIITTGSLFSNLSDKAKKQSVQDSKTLYKSLAQKPKTALTMGSLTQISAIYNLLKEQAKARRLPFKTTLKRIAFLINKTGGLRNFARAIQNGPVLMLNIIDNYASSSEAASKYIRTWQLINKNRRHFRKFNPRKESTYVLIGMYSKYKNISKVFKALLAIRKKPIDLEKDKSTIVRMAKRLKKSPGLSPQSAYRKEFERFQKERSTDPLKLEPKQKLSVLTFMDKTVTQSSSNFYLRQALQSNYGNKISNFSSVNILGGVSANPLAGKKAMVLKHIREAITQNNKLLIFISAHGDKHSDVTSVGNILELLVAALKKSPAGLRKQFIEQNLVIGTNQCYGGRLLKRFKQEFGTSPHFNFSESGASSANLGYINFSQKLSQSSKFLRVYYSKSMEFKAKGHWTDYQGNRITSKPTFTRILHYIDAREKTLDVQMNLN